MIKLYKEGRAWIEINRENLHHNIRILQSLLPSECHLMPAVKANAYGHGAVLIAKELNACGVKSCCVATVAEGAELRKNGVEGEILVLGYTHPEQFSILEKYNLIQTVVDYSYAKLLDIYGAKVKVHLKIDTGMHRLGMDCENMAEIIRVFGCNNLVVEGIYTHLCASDDTAPRGREYTYLQGKKFYRVLAQLERNGYPCPKIHLQSSYGILHYPELAGDYARPGIALYGVLSSRRDLPQAGVPLSPILSVKARVVLVKSLSRGESAGYGLQYVADKDKKIAVLSIGYADGIPRSLSFGGGNVLVGSGIAPIIGSVCMDQMLVDITDIPDVSQGDVAVVIGRSGDREISVYDLAEQEGTITNEILSRLGNRLERVLISGISD